MDEPSAKTDGSSSLLRHEIRRAKDHGPKTLDLALTMFRQRQIKVMDFWLDQGVWHFKIISPRSS